MERCGDWLAVLCLVLVLGPGLAKAALVTCRHCRLLLLVGWSGTNLPPTPCRWRATPLRLDNWTAWFKEQAALANAPLDRGLYVGLRLDGRVRASGTGCPPWQKFALQLPPVEGVFGGFLDGMDGRVI